MPRFGPDKHETQSRTDGSDTETDVDSWAVYAVWTVVQEHGPCSVDEIVQESAEPPALTLEILQALAETDRVHHTAEGWSA